LVRRWSAASWSKLLMRSRGWETKGLLRVVTLSNTNCRWLTSLKEVNSWM